MFYKFSIIDIGFLTSFVFVLQTPKNKNRFYEPIIFNINSDRMYRHVICLNTCKDITQLE